MKKFRKLDREDRDVDNSIRDKVMQEASALFPIDGNFFRLDASNFSYKGDYASLSKIKDSLLKGSSIMASLNADMVLYDKNKKKVIDKGKRSFLRLPQFTKKSSFIVDGNSYTLPYQQRLRPGVYTLKKRNGEINTMFNLGKGRNFNIKIDASGTMRIKIGTSHVFLYSILKDLGVSDAAMADTWGKELLESNRKRYSSSDKSKFLKSFSYSKSDDVKEHSQSDLKDAINSSTLNRDSVRETLGIESDSLNPEIILKASKRLIGVYSGKEEQDDRENMIFKKIMAPEDLVGEAFTKNIREEVNKIKFKLNKPDISKIEDVLGAGNASTTRPIKNFVVSSKVSRMGEEYNPLMVYMSKHLISPMGEGGVGDSRALNNDTKAVHPSHLGFIDPIVSPEGSSVGVTLAVTGNAYIDETGAPAIRVANAKTGKKEILTVAELWKKKLAYPTSKERADQDGVMVRVGNIDMKAKSRKDVDYIIGKTSDMHAPSSNVVPLINSSDANRTNMAQKHTQQALSVTGREAPLVSVDHGGGIDEMDNIMRKSGHLPYSPVNGKVTKINTDTIEISDANGKKHKIDYVTDMPLARKTFIDHKPSVKVGDTVKKGQHLADSNFTSGGKLAIGKNMRTAWLSVPGNRNDGIIISESAAEAFTSEHMYKENVAIPAGDILDKKRFKNLFPSVLSKWGESNYDAHGIIKKGSKIIKGQPMVVRLSKTDSRQFKTKLEKVMHKPFKAIIDTWHHNDDGIITDVQNGGSDVKITIKMSSRAKVGDKLSGRQGNKGIITKIIPDDERPKNGKGEAIDVALTSAGVISRTNGGSLIEAGLGKIADKTKKGYILEHYTKKDNLKFMEDEAKKHGVDIRETLINPETGKPFPNKIFVGKPYIMKLFKDSESGLSAVGVGGTDIDEQPLKGGKESASAISNMEINAVLAYGAKGLAREIRDVKGQRNDDYFDAFRRGVPTPKPADNFASSKFNAYLTQLGVDVHRDAASTEFSLMPKTDKEIVAQSSGRIKNSDTVYAKTGRVSKGGLFDETIFGGPMGKRYGHIKLETQILNPLYKEPVAMLLGVTADSLDKRMKREGISWITKAIGKIDIKKELSRREAESRSSRNPQLINKNAKVIKFLRKSDSLEGKIKEYAFMSNIPVIPPVFRPISKDGNGDVSINDLNLHYQDIKLLSDTIGHSRGGSEKTRGELEYDLYKSVGALFGTEESPNKKIRDKKVKGVLNILGGDTPKLSFIHKKLLRKKQFMSGRGVIKPARTDIGVDEIEIPEKQGLVMYEPHISRKLSQQGYSPVEAQEMIDNKHQKAIDTMKVVAKDIPLVYNRAPTLWRHNAVGGFPKFIKGDTIGVNPLIERSMNSDYDGDQIGLHVPVTKAGIKDIKEKMMPSKNLFSDQGSFVNRDLLLLPDQDATLGIYKASRPSNKRAIKVANIQELKKRLASGDIQYNDKVEVG